MEAFARIVKVFTETRGYVVTRTVIRMPSNGKVILVERGQQEAFEPTGSVIE